MKKYIEIADGIEAKLHNCILYVRTTSMRQGCLEQGGIINRIIAAPYAGTMDEAQAENEYGISDIDRLIRDDRDGLARIIRHGKIIN